MDPDAKVQVATLGTALYYREVLDSGNFIGQDGSYNPDDLETALENCTRIYGLASTPDFGGQPNTIDSTTLDNTRMETSVLGLQPAAEVTYEINMMTFEDVPDGVQHNLRTLKALQDEADGAGLKVHWILVKASGVIIEYDAKVKLSYTADAQQDIEKFAIYHDIKSDIAVSLPAEVEPKTLTKIEVTTQPTKTTYTAGENFDPTGMVVTATYSDTTTSTITDYTYSPSGALATTDTTVTITKDGKTATVAITVNQA